MTCDKHDYEYDSPVDLKRPYSRARLWIDSDTVDSIWNTVGFGSIAGSVGVDLIKDEWPKLAKKLSTTAVKTLGLALAAQSYAMTQVDDGCGVVWTFYDFNLVTPTMITPPAQTLSAQ